MLKLFWICWLLYYIGQSSNFRTSTKEIQTSYEEYEGFQALLEDFIRIIENKPPQQFINLNINPESDYKWEASGVYKLIPYYQRISPKTSESSSRFIIQKHPFNGQWQLTEIYDYIKRKPNELFHRTIYGGFPKEQSSFFLDEIVIQSIPTLLTENERLKKNLEIQDEFIEKITQKFKNNLSKKDEKIENILIERVKQIVTMKEIQDENKKLKIEINKLDNTKFHIDEIKIENEIWQQKFIEMKKWYQNLDSKLKEVKNELSQEQRKSEEFKKEINQKKNKTKKSKKLLKDRSDKFETKLTQMKEEYEKIKDDYEKLKKQFDEKSGENENLTKRFEKNNETQIYDNFKNGKHLIKIAKLLVEKKEMENKISVLEEKLKTHEKFKNDFKLDNTENIDILKKCETKKADKIGNKLNEKRFGIEEQNKMFIETCSESKKVISCESESTTDTEYSSVTNDLENLEFAKNLFTTQKYKFEKVEDKIKCFENDNQKDQNKLEQKKDNKINQILEEIYQKAMIKQEKLKKGCDDLLFYMLKNFECSAKILNTEIEDVHDAKVKKEIEEFFVILKHLPWNDAHSREAFLYIHHGAINYFNDQKKIIDTHFQKFLMEFNLQFEAIDVWWSTIGRGLYMDTLEKLKKIQECLLHITLKSLGCNATNAEYKKEQKAKTLFNILRKKPIFFEDSKYEYYRQLKNIGYTHHGSKIVYNTFKAIILSYFK